MSLFLKIKHFAVIKWDQPKAFSRHKKSFFSVFLSLSSFPQLFIQLWLLSTRPFFTSFLSFILLWSRKNLLGKKSRKAPHFYFIYWTYTSLRLDGMAKNDHFYLCGYARAHNLSGLDPFLSYHLMPKRNTIWTMLGSNPAHQLCTRYPFPLKSNYRKGSNFSWRSFITFTTW